MLDLLPVVDIETTGLEPEEDVILEVSLLAIDLTLDVKGQFSVVINAPLDIERMTPFVVEMHRANGLLEEVAGSPHSLQDAEKLLIEQYYLMFGETQLPMSGSSVHFDRKFLAEHMPAFNDCFHYRNIDVSTLKELARRFSPQTAVAWEQQQHKLPKTHRASADVLNTVSELKFYLDSIALGQWRIPQDEEFDRYE